MNAVGDVLGRKDRPPYVSFHKVPVEDKAASREQGHYVAKDVDYVHVTPPYSKDLNKFKVTDWLVQLERDARNNRIPPEWVENYKKQYRAWCEGQELPPNGSPIKGWGVISPAQQETLIRLNILTVEDLAAINDEGIRRIGMGAVDLKNKAKAWLAQLNDVGPLTQEFAAVKARNRELEASVETLARQVKALMAQQEGPGKPPAEASEEITANDLIDDRDDLAAQYKAKFGKAPHPNISIENLRMRVSE